MIATSWGCVMRIDGGSVADPQAEEIGTWADPEPPSNIRSIQRFSTAFWMYCIESLTRVAGNDLMMGLVYTAMWTANVKHITHSAANIEYGGLDQIPPDAERRPVTVMALANSLRMPHETVRRHVHALLKDDRCVRVGNKGFIVPARVFDRQDHKAAIVEGLPVLLRLLENMKLNGFDFGPYRRALPNTVPLPPDGTPPANIRAMARVIAEMVMRGVDMLGSLRGDDFLYGLIYTAIWVIGAREIVATPHNLKYGALRQPLPDEVVRPVTVSTLANELHVPYETVRRSANRLVSHGVALRLGNRGLIIPRAQHEKPEAYATLRRSQNNLVRMVGDLHRAGFDFRSY